MVKQIIRFFSNSTLDRKIPAGSLSTTVKQRSGIQICTFSELCSDITQTAQGRDRQSCRKADQQIVFLETRIDYLEVGSLSEMPELEQSCGHTNQYGTRHWRSTYDGPSWRPVRLSWRPSVLAPSGWVIWNVASIK